MSVRRSMDQGVRQVAGQSQRFYFHDAVDDAGFVCPDRLVGRWRERSAGAQTEARAMPWTNDDIAFDRTASQSAAIVRADVVDCVELAVDIEDRDQRVIDFDLCEVAADDGSGGSDGNPGHEEVCIGLISGSSRSPHPGPPPATGGGE